MQPATDSTPRLEIHPSRTAFQPEDLIDGIAVVFDVLRATTSLVAAMSAGCERVWPTEDLESARALAARRRADRDPSTVLLAGERHCLMPEGFDLGNSPAEHGSPVVRGRELVFSTTNGTRALLASRRARAIWVGCFWNRAALVQRLLEELRTGEVPAIHLVAAGTAGRVAYDDVLGAAAVAQALQASADLIPGDGVHACTGAWRPEFEDPARLREALGRSQAAENLRRAGLEDDLERVAQLDIRESVPSFDPDRGWVDDPYRHG